MRNDDDSTATNNRPPWRSRARGLRRPHGRLLLAIAVSFAGIAAPAGTVAADNSTVSVLGSRGAPYVAQLPQQQTWRLPVASAEHAEPPQLAAVLERGFIAPAGPYAAGHRGVDLRSEHEGSVIAPAGGVITFAGQVAGRGVVVIDHQNGLRSSFEPVVPAQGVGTRVSPGEFIAAISTTPGHCAPSTCLHWGVRRADNSYVDPLTLIGAYRIVLLPVTPIVAVSTASEGSLSWRGCLPGVPAAPSSRPCASARPVTR